MLLKYRLHKKNLLWWEFFGFMVLKEQNQEGNDLYFLFPFKVCLLIEHIPEEITNQNSVIQLIWCLFKQWLNKVAFINMRELWLESQMNNLINAQGTNAYSP